MLKKLILLIAFIVSISLNSYADNKVLIKNDPSEVSVFYRKHSCSYIQTFKKIRTRKEKTRSHEVKTRNRKSSCT